MNNKNCAQCKNLKLGGMKNAPLVYCESVNKTVPQLFKGEAFLLWRIPEFCPRTDVVKTKNCTSNISFSEVTLDEMIKNTK